MTDGGVPMDHVRSERREDPTRLLSPNGPTRREHPQRNSIHDRQ